MKIVVDNNLTDAQRVALVRRPDRSIASLDATVAELCRDVRSNGDDAVRRLTSRFDGVSPDRLRLTEEEIGDGASLVATEVLEAIAAAARNIRAFHTAQGVKTSDVETLPGVRCWREVRPIRSVGLYVPAGSAPLPSTVLMLGVPATLAGCDRIALCSPPRANGTVDPTVLAAAQHVGITEIYRVGGVQAIAALAYGTASIPKADKIFGPGNAYVSAAKRFVAGDPDGCAIDLIAGPSELLIIADGSADPRRVAADLLSQAEHDPSSPVVLVTTDASLAERSSSILADLARTTPRAAIVEQSLRHAFALVVETLDAAVAFSNAYAPEHLIIDTSDPLARVPSIRNAGSVFLGPWSPVTAGDYASGTNHTLPTGGEAARTSGLSLESFQTVVSFQSLTADGLSRLRPTLKALGTAEGLPAHVAAVEARFA
jgi:histidinol dehydrogenase